MKLVGTTSNRSAIGAKVRVRATIQGASRWQLRDVSGGDGQANQQSLNTELGLGDATTIETLRVEWPSRAVQEWHDVAPRQFLTITEHCTAFGDPGASDIDDDRIPDSCDSCPAIANANQADADGDGVGDLCDSCVNVPNFRVPADFLANNPWATLTGGQRDDDHDGYGNRCDADFTPAGTLVGSGDLARFRQLSGKIAGPKCPTCPLACQAGADGSCQ